MDDAWGAISAGSGNEVKEVEEVKSGTAMSLFIWSFNIGATEVRQLLEQSESSLVSIMAW